MLGQGEGMKRFGACRWWVVERRLSREDRGVARLKLLEEPQIVFDQDADIRFAQGFDDVVLPYDEPFDAEAERPAGVDFRIDAAGREDANCPGGE